MRPIFNCEFHKLSHLLKLNLIFYIFILSWHLSPQNASNKLLAQGFDLKGFAATGLTAMSGLKSKTNYYLKNLFQGKDIYDLAPWTEKFLDMNENLSNSFYQYYSHKGNDSSKCSSLEFIETPSIPSLIKMTEDLYLFLKSDPSFPIENPIIKDLQLNEAEAIALLCYSIISLHKPLRYSNTSQNFGKEINVKVPKSGSRGAYNSFIFDLWEETLVKNTAIKNPSLWNQGWTHVNSQGSQFTSDTSDFEKTKEAIFQKWAYEPAVRGCSLLMIYSGPSEASISHDHIEIEWVHHLKQSIIKSGIRIAVVLNSLYANKPTTKLKSVKSLRPLDDSINPLAKHLIPNWTVNLLINLGISCIVLGILLYAINYYSYSKPTISSTDTSQEASNNKEMKSF